MHTRIKSAKPKISKISGKKRGTGTVCPHLDPLPPLSAPPSAATVILLPCKTRSASSVGQLARHSQKTTRLQRCNTPKGICILLWIVPIVAFGTQTSYAAT